MLQSKDATPPRPRWQWVVFGVVLMFGAWMPFALIAQAVSLRLSPLRGEPSWETFQRRLGALSSWERTTQIAALALPHLLGLFASCLAAGYVVRRWGPDARVAVLSGFAGGLLAVGMVWMTTGPAWSHLFVIPFAIAGSSCGAALGGRARAA